MTHNVKVESHMVTTVGKILEEYWCMRGIKRINRSLSVCKEEETESEPTPTQIAQFLEDSGADFVTVEHNYRFVDDLPFR